MKISLLQTNIAWRDATQNIARAETLMEEHPGADLYVLPEMWATGFDMRPTADTMQAADEGLHAMLRIAAQRNCHIAATLPAGAEGKRFNRFYVVGPEGVCTAYDKRHLFTYGGEQQAYAPGKERVVVEIAGVRILLQICYDLRFPVFSRCRGDYDLILYAANWPASRRAVWDILLQARAIENQCYVCGVNRVGNDPIVAYSGGTAVISPRGKVEAAAPDNEEAVVSFSPDMDGLRAFRRKFPALDDADRFSL